MKPIIFTFATSKKAILTDFITPSETKLCLKLPDHNQDLYLADEINKEEGVNVSDVLRLHSTEDKGSILILESDLKPGDLMMIIVESLSVIFDSSIYISRERETSNI